LPGSCCPPPPHASSQQTLCLLPSAFCLLHFQTPIPLSEFMGFGCVPPRLGFRIPRLAFRVPLWRWSIICYWAVAPFCLLPSAFPQPPAPRRGVLKSGPEEHGQKSTISC